MQVALQFLATVTPVNRHFPINQYSIFWLTGFDRTLPKYSAALCKRDSEKGGEGRESIGSECEWGKWEEEEEEEEEKEEEEEEGGKKISL